MKQGTEEWHNARMGKLTASRVGDAIATTKSGPSMRVNTLMNVLLAERLTGRRKEVPVTQAMQWGIDHEPLAKKWFNENMATNGRVIEDGGFHEHPTISGLAASPDGFYDGHIVEIKCPQEETHVDYLRACKIPSKYKPQMLTQMACTGLKKGIFISYHPNFELQLVCYYCPPELEFEQLEAKCKAFLDKLNAEERKLRERAQEKRQAKEARIG